MPTLLQAANGALNGASVDAGLIGGRGGEVRVILAEVLSDKEEAYLVRLADERRDSPTVDFDEVLAETPARPE